MKKKTHTHTKGTKYTPLPPTNSNYKKKKKIYLILKKCWIYEIEYDPSGDSNSSFHVGADLLNLLLSHDIYFFSMCNIYKIW